MDMAIPQPEKVSSNKTPTEEARELFGEEFFTPYEPKDHNDQPS